MTHPNLKLIVSTLLIITSGLSLSKEPSVLVTKQKIQNLEKSALKKNLPDEEFRIKVMGFKSEVPDLIIPTYSTVNVRIAATSLSLNQIEVVIQMDEFRLDYSDYRLVDGKWILKIQKRVCSLNGSLAMALAQVDIHEGGIVEIKYHEGISSKRILSWDKELIQKDHKENDKLLSERYLLKDGEFQLLGKSVRLRPQK